jgi:hypothetical protein
LQPLLRARKALGGEREPWHGCKGVRATQGVSHDAIFGTHIGLICRSSIPSINYLGHQEARAFSPTEAHAALGTTPMHHESTFE